MRVTVQPCKLKKVVFRCILKRDFKEKQAFMNSDKINFADVKENQLLHLDKEILTQLLKDRTTDKNILWCTDNYKKYGPKYEKNQQITIDLITFNNGNVIKPRIEKNKQEQQQRIRDKAEVFTPSWVCNAQNNLIDNDWFGRENVFNTEKEAERTWVTNHEKIVFPDKDGRRWKDYVEGNRLEITCGEAPYVTSRYDTVSGNYIEVPDRAGFLDRKLRVVTENTTGEEEWLKWAYTAVQSSYAFEWQGDNLLIARENLLFSVKEYFEYVFKKSLETKHLIEFAKIISWNVWQMDGLKFVVPESCTHSKIEHTLFGEEEVSKECDGCKSGDNFKHNGLYCKIMNWKENKTVRYVDVFGKK